MSFALNVGFGAVLGGVVIKILDRAKMTAPVEHTAGVHSRATNLVISDVLYVWTLEGRCGIFPPGEVVLLERLLLGPGQDPILQHLLAVLGPQGQQDPHGDQDRWPQNCTNSQPF